MVNSIYKESEKLVNKYKTRNPPEFVDIFVTDLLLPDSEVIYYATNYEYTAEQIAKKMNIPKDLYS